MRLLLSFPPRGNAKICEIILGAAWRLVEKIRIVAQQLGDLRSCTSASCVAALMNKAMHALEFPNFEELSVKILAKFDKIFLNTPM